MHSTLLPMLEADEEYQHPVYSLFSTGNIFYSATTFGFMATTNHQRLLVAHFKLTGIPQGNCAYSLQSLQSVKISKALLTPIHSIKLRFNIDGKMEKIDCTITQKVPRSDLDYQEQNLENLIAELRKWGN